jgi:4-hydroxythreonine-4-phosphate dehydrogenase
VIRRRRPLRPPRPDAPAAARPVVAVTMGDPAGVGPELCLSVLADPAVLAVCTPVVFGDAAVLRRVAAACGRAADYRVLVPDALASAPPTGPTVVDHGVVNADAVTPGRVSAECGRAACRYIERAVEAVRAGHAVALATAPIHKEALHLAGVRYPGHTEMLAALTGAARVCMMMASDKIVVSLATVHVALADVAGRLTRQAVLDAIELTHEAMRAVKGRGPRIAVCALNPHAGEGGLFGREEREIVGPAMETARARGIVVEGPLPPDTAFLPAVRRRTDAYVAMYHDQGLIPFKMLSFESGVNVTLGLPIVRTSVDHGTAFDIAWRGIASAASLRQSLFWALRLTEPRSAVFRLPVAGEASLRTFDGS